MDTREISLLAVREVEATLARMDPAQGAALADALLAANRIFVAGAGRAGNIMKGFAMRLMHMDLCSFVAGESVTPAIGPGDLLVLGSGSGETASAVSMAAKAGTLGAKVALITTRPQSQAAGLAHVVVEIPAVSKLAAHTGTEVLQPMANCFEQCLVFFTDSVTMLLMERLDKTSDQMYRNHANLE